MLDLALRLVASLAVVVGLLLLLARVAARRFAGRAGAPVQVLHRQPLSRSSALAVVSVGSRVLVLGTTDQQVRLLAELDPDELGTTPLELVDGDLPDDEDDEQVLASPRTIPAPVPAGVGALSGSLLSARTWRQAFAAATGRTS